MIIQPARQFSFLVAGIIPPGILTDDEAKLYLCAMRNILFALMANAVAATPDRAQLDQITLTPYLGPTGPVLVK